MDQYRKWCQQGFRVIKHIVYCRCIPIDRNGISVIIPDGEGAGSAQLRYPNLWPITTRSTASTASTTLVISEDSTIKSEDFAPGAAAGDGEAPPSGPRRRYCSSRQLCRAWRRTLWRLSRASQRRRETWKQMKRKLTKWRKNWRALRSCMMTLSAQTKTARKGRDLLPLLRSPRQSPCPSCCPLVIYHLVSSELSSSLDTKQEGL